MYLLKGFQVWLIIILAETIHGILRNMFLQPLIGDLPARQIGVFIGSFLILIISLIFVERLQAENTYQLLIIGLFWVFLTVCFEFLLGKLMNFSIERILEDYNLKIGGLMIFGLVFMLFAPLLAKKIRKI